MARFRMLSFVCLLLLVVSAPALAQQGSDTFDLKAIWDSLSEKEKEAYAAGWDDVERTPGDTCAAATLEVSGLPFNDSNTTVGQTDDLSFGTDCGGFSAGSGDGPDIAYRVMTDVTCDVNVSMTPAANDLFLSVVTDCGDAAGSCIGGDDASGGGGTEDVAFTATGGVEHFIVVDGFNGASDTFDLSITETGATGCALVPVELQSFSID